MNLKISVFSGFAHPTSFSLAPGKLKLPRKARPFERVEPAPVKAGGGNPEKQEQDFSNKISINCGETLNFQNKTGVKSRKVQVKQTGKMACSPF